MKELDKMSREKVEDLVTRTIETRERFEDSRHAKAVFEFAAGFRGVFCEYSSLSQIVSGGAGSKYAALAYGTFACLFSVRMETSCSITWAEI
jgi:hypothetical protein